MSKLYCNITTPFVAAIFYTYSFYTDCQENINTPSPIDYTFVDSPRNDVSIKNNDDQPSQTSYDDEASESNALVSANTSTPISTSMSSKTSCSSGYHSGGSYVDESVNLKSIQPSFPEITDGVLSTQVNQQGRYEKFPVSSITTSPIQGTHKIRNDELVLSSSESSEDISIHAQRELTSPTNSWKVQSHLREPLNSCKNDNFDKRTLQIDSSVHKSIYAMSKRTCSPVLTQPSTGKENELTMENWSVFHYNCMTIIIIYLHSTYQYSHLSPMYSYNTIPLETYKEG